MASVNLIDLLSVGCDIELQFEDGTMPANSGALRVFSSVTDHALDAQECQTPAKARKASASSTPATASTDERTIIPLPGVTKEQWLRVAEFLYPVVPSPKIEDWHEAEFLLEMGKKFDMQLLLHKVDLYLEPRAPEMTRKQPQKDYWKWLKLADSAGLTVCVPAIVKRITEGNKHSCTKDENLQGLSVASFSALVKALAGAT